MNVSAFADFIVEHSYFGCFIEILVAAAVGVAVALKKQVLSYERNFPEPAISNRLSRSRFAVLVALAANFDKPQKLQPQLRTVTKKIVIFVFAVSRFAVAVAVILNYWVPRYGKDTFKVSTSQVKELLRDNVEGETG